jgi:hypothetical protein
MEAAMRPTTAFNDNVIDLDALLHPGTAFEHPRDVVSRPDLGLRRACLRRRDATFSPQAGQCDKVSMGTLRDHESCGEPASEA